MKQLRTRIPHIMKTKKDVRHPSNFFFFDTETKDQRKNKTKDVQHHTLWFGCVWAFRYEQQKVTRSFKTTFSDVDGFYRAVEKRLDKVRPLYIVAHNLGFDLTIVDWWDRAETLGMTCLYAVLEDPPLFMSYAWKGCKIIVIDTFNFWKCSVADMGRSLGIEKIEIDITNCTKKDAMPYCQRDVEIIANQLVSLLDYLTDNDLGSFGISAPAVAMNTFKKRFMSHEIFIHDRSKVLALERQAYYGGLVNNFFVGRSRGEVIYHTDINSLYPSVMLNQYPVKMIDSMEDVRLDHKLFDDELLGFVGDVTINTFRRSYPKRFKGRLCEVRGRYRTQLCGIELAIALSENHVQHIHQLAAYQMAPIFKDYVEYFWHQRQLHSQPKGNPKEQLIKLLMNSLYGKFGMKGFDWIDYSRGALTALYQLCQLEIPSQYDNETYTPAIQGHVSLWHAIGLPFPVKVRYLAGKLQIQIPTGEHTESFCGIAAFVTSYARERLRNLITLAGPNNTYYCDTDSLFLNEAGYTNLYSLGEVNDKLLGKLKLEGVSSQWAFYGPKDYTFGKKKVLKGIKKNAKEVAPQTYQQTQFEGLKSVLNRGGAPYIIISTVTKRNKRVYSKGSVSHTGWTNPFILSE